MSYGVYPFTILKQVGLSTMEVYAQINVLRQVHYTYGQIVHATPDELFDQYCSLAVSLPENSSTWPIQLCSCFLSALSKELMDHVTSDSNFKIPNLNKLTSNALQLDTL